MEIYVPIEIDENIEKFSISKLDYMNNFLIDVFSFNRKVKKKDANVYDVRLRLTYSKYNLNPYLFADNWTIMGDNGKLIAKNIYSKDWTTFIRKGRYPQFDDYMYLMLLLSDYLTRNYDYLKRKDTKIIVKSRAFGRNIKLIIDRFPFEETYENVWYEMGYENTEIGFIYDELYDFLMKSIKNKGDESLYLKNIWKKIWGDIFDVKIK